MAEAVRLIIKNVITIMRSPVRKRKNPSTALFVCNEPMTSGALLALRENEVKIPQEIAIIGFDDPVWAPLTEPALTTVSQPSYSMGTLACQVLLKEIKGVGHSEIPSEDIILKPKLITRESSEKRIVENFDVEMAFLEDDK